MDRVYRIAGLFLLTAGFSLCTVNSLQAQIGGLTADSAPVLIDDFEDLDMTADGVGRTWVPSDASAVSIDLATPPSLSLGPGQSPLGALHLNLVAKFGFSNGSVGVPVPGVYGASTLPEPGDMTSFQSLEFYARSGFVSGQIFQVILECYPQNPDTTFPKAYWNFTPAVGNTYQNCVIDLHNPHLIENAGTLTIEDLLSKTRFLAFYGFAGPIPNGTKVELSIDDIRLTTQTSISNWYVYN